MPQTKKIKCPHCQGTGMIKKEPLVERKEAFVRRVFNNIQEHYPDQGAELFAEFCSYWTEHNENGKKMRWEMEKVFDIKRRLATWIKNSKKFQGKQAGEDHPVMDKGWLINMAQGRYQR